MSDDQERKLFVGSLSKDNTNEEHLNDFFATYGNVVDVTVMRDQDKRSRGFGFVIFDDVSAIDKIMSLKREGMDFVINNNRAELKRALPQVPGGGKAVAPRNDFRKVFVGGLPPHTSEDDITSYFTTNFGKVLQVEIPRYQDTGKVKGFAFVTFDHEDTADKCLARRSHLISGRVVDVKRATTKPPPPTTTQNKGDVTTASNHGNSGASTTTPEGEMSLDEVERLLTQAFMMGQKSVHGSQNEEQAKSAADSLLSSVKNPPSSSNNILMNALAGILGNGAPSAPAPTPALPPGVEQIAQVLQSSGIDASALAGLIRT